MTNCLLVGVVQTGVLLLSCSTLFAFGDCLVYFLWQLKLSEALGVKLHEWTGWLLVLYIKKGCDLVLKSAPHKRPKGTSCFCSHDISKRRETGWTVRNTGKGRKDDLSQLFKFHD